MCFILKILLISIISSIKIYFAYPCDYTTDGKIDENTSYDVDLIRGKMKKEKEFVT